MTAWFADFAWVLRGMGAILCEVARFSALRPLRSRRPLLTVVATAAFHAKSS